MYQSQLYTKHSIPSESALTVCLVFAIAQNMRQSEIKSGADVTLLPLHSSQVGEADTMECT